MEEIREWFTIFMRQLRQTSLLEYLGVGFGVVQVLLAKSNRVLLYPFGIASVLITLYVLYDAGLYAEVLLNLYYLLMSIYGWWHWNTGGGMAGGGGAGSGQTGNSRTGSTQTGSNKTPKPRTVQVSYSSRQEWGIAIGIVLLGVPLLYWALVSFTDSTVPVWDSLVTAAAWAGMWLLARRKIENWLLLNISNALAIPLLAYKGLPLYSLLTLFLFIVAVFGYFEWRKIIAGRQKERTGPAGEGKVAKEVRE